jgi:DNA topoisomerase IB
METEVTPVESWLSVLVGLVLGYRRDVDRAALAQHLKGQVEAAKPVFAKTGKIGTAVFNILISELAKGSVSDSRGLPRGKYAAYMAGMRRDMRKSLASFYSSPDINEAQVKLAKAAVALLAPDSATVDSKDAALDRLITVLPNRLLRQMCTPAESLKKSDQQKHLDDLRALVKSQVKRNDTKLTKEELDALKVKKRDLFKHYNKLRKNVNESWKAFVRGFCRERGGTAKVSELIPAMNKAGITVHPYTGYERLRVGENGSLYTTTGSEILSVVAPDSQIKWNKDYDPKKDEGYVFLYKTPMMADFRPGYTRAGIRKRKQSTYAKILKAIESVPKQRPRWLKDLKSSDSHRRILGTMVEILYQHALRVGGLKNQTDGKATYGLTTLKLDHVRTLSGGFVLAYPGKKGVMQKHVVKPDTPENKLVCAVLTKAMRGKKKGDFLWTDAHGERIGAGELNGYLRRMGVSITAHKFRHVRGTELMQNLLANAKVPKGSNQAAVEKQVKALAVKVGSLLGHVSGEKVTPATAIKSYIVPDVIARFFSERGMRVPAWLPKSRASEAGDE